jgi:hypothetical protein
MPWKAGGAKRYNIEVNLIGPGDVIRPGESTLLVYLAAGSMSEFKALDGDQKLIAENKFAAAAFSLPVQIRACSLTERTCGLIGEPLPAQCKNIP